MRTTLVRHFSLSFSPRTVAIIALSGVQRTHSYIWMRSRITHVENKDPFLRENRRLVFQSNAVVLLQSRVEITVRRRVSKIRTK